MPGFFQGPLRSKPADPFLLSLLDSPDQEIRYHAGTALMECTDPKLAEPAFRFSQSKEARFRKLAAYLAGNLPSDTFAVARDRLVHLLSDDEEAVTFVALRSFARHHDLAAAALWCCGCSSVISWPNNTKSP